MKKIKIRGKEIERKEWDGLTPFQIGIAEDATYLYCKDRGKADAVILAIDSFVGVISTKDDPTATEIELRPGKSIKRDWSGKPKRERSSQTWAIPEECENGYWRVNVGAGSAYGQLPDEIIDGYLNLIEVVCDPDDFIPIEKNVQ